MTKYAGFISVLDDGRVKLTSTHCFAHYTAPDSYSPITQSSSILDQSLAGLMKLNLTCLLRNDFFNKQNNKLKTAISSTIKRARGGGSNLYAQLDRVIYEE